MVEQQYCDHFDCACPPFVTDGRVGQSEWGDYVEAMQIPYEQLAQAKVVLQAGEGDLPRWERGDVAPVRRPFQEMSEAMDVADVLREEAENAEQHRDADITYVRHREQPRPVPREGQHIQQLVIEDMTERYRLGVQRYGVGLQTRNGRDMLRDLYEELLDACVYVRGVIAERKELEDFRGQVAELAARLRDGTFRGGSAAEAVQELVDRWK